MAIGRRKSNKKSDKKAIPVLPWDVCLAKTVDRSKPGLRVIEHLLAVRAVAKKLSNFLPDDWQSRLLNFIDVCSGIHDLGKVSPGFQKKLMDVCTELPEAFDRISSLPSGCESDHCVVGSSAVRELPFDDEVRGQIEWVVGSHHGFIRRQPPCSSKRWEAAGGESWALEREKLIKRVFPSFDFPLECLCPEELYAVTGLVVVSDWIGSDEVVFSPDSVRGDETYEDLADKAVSSCGFRKPIIRSGKGFSDVFGFQPYEHQQVFIDAVTSPGLYVLEAPMGGGKTEAALYAAYQLIEQGQNSGIYFALPTRLTSDRIHQRMADFISQVTEGEWGAKLAHGSAWLTEFRNGGVELAPGNEWFNPTKRALLYPFSVGTIDQALLGVIRAKHHFVRLFGLTGKVVILDEVHSYDLYTGTLLDELVRTLLSLRCTVIVLSATLTSERLIALAGGKVQAALDKCYPSITAISDDSVRTIDGVNQEGLDYLVSLATDEIDDLAELVCQRAIGGERVLCIANSVAKAQQWYDRIAAEMPRHAFDLGLLHSKFPGYRREELEDEWMERLGPSSSYDSGCVLVATQVVEQSVDIDADYLVTELAPMDFILQRMGRLWRHRNRHRLTPHPETLIVSGELASEMTQDEIVEALGKVNCLIYSPYMLWCTLDVLTGIKKVNIPNDIRLLLSKTYDERSKLPNGVEHLRAQMLIKREKLRGLALSTGACVTSLPSYSDQSDDDHICTRYNSVPTVRVLLVRDVEDLGDRANLVLLDGKEVSVSQYYRGDIETTRALHRNTVAVASYYLPRRDSQKNGWLEKHFHRTTPLLLLDELTGHLSLDGSSTKLGYTNVKGVMKILDAPEGNDYGKDYYSDYDDEIDPFEYGNDW